ncbi:STAS-like domain-containing protein [Leptospira sp. 201903074]|uniref:STAS-like domain-containing protein n=1 Tax=Leptospira abararensis TaxID=2810036 RepID=UPI001962EFE9|nr:STAS-like domain-containing protein [Leptospira abararensis]MBM9547784.1 STAS-like domain-containing protein [Leptospira abararensis]
MVIQLKDYIVNGYSNNEGEIIHSLILKNFDKTERIEISFIGMGAVSSSFVNCAFINLLEYYTFSEIKSKIYFTNTLKIHNDLIKDRFSFETALRLTAP